MSKKDDAIHSDVSDADNGADNEETQQERPKSQRELGMEMMEARRREQLAEEGVELEAADGEKKEKDDKGADEQIEQQLDETETEDERAEREQEERAAKERETAEATAAASAAGGRLVVVDGKTMVKTKTDGKEELVPFDTVVAQFQKGNAADRRLEEATKLLEEARTARETATTEKEKKAAEKAVQDAAKDLETLETTLLESMYGGEQDTAKKALREYVTSAVETALKGRDTATSDEAIIARVTPKVKQSLAVESALKQFQKDFPKIATDPHLAAKADAFLNEAVAAGKAYDDAFKEAGEKTMGWMRDTLGLKTSVTVSTARTERTDRKKEIDNPSSTSAKTPSNPDAPIQQNVAASIAEMRKGRISG